PDPDRVDDDSEEEALGPSQYRRGPAAVPDLGQFGVGDDLRASPEPRADVDEDDMRDGEVPPLPVTRYAAGSDHTRDVQRRGDGEGRRGHGSSSQPPRQRSAPYEEVDHAAGRPTRQIQPDEQGYDHVDRN